MRLVSLRVRDRQATLAGFRAPSLGSSTSLWLTQALAVEPGEDRRDQSPLRPHADVCVVGGGFTGLWTAIGLKRRDPSIDVVVLEAGICGGAASGRNGGFVMTVWSKFGSLAKLCGTADALSYARAAEAAIGDIGRFCDEHKIDAQLRRAGWLWAATNEQQLDAWSGTLEALAAAGAAPYRVLEGDEAARLSGSQIHLAGVLESGAATLHPGHLVRGLRRVARELGVTVHEFTPVHAVRSDPVPAVTTDRGTLRSDRVVLAINAWAAELRAVRHALVVLASDVIATEPAAERLQGLGLAEGFSISDSRRLVHYYRTTLDGRLVFGKGGGAIVHGARIRASFDQSPGSAEIVRSHFRRTYPMLRDVAVPHHWRGAVDYSVSGLPFVGPLPDHPEILLAAGYSGNGVGPAALAGAALASMALGGDGEPVPEAMRRPPVQRLPPEPLRVLGGALVRAAQSRNEDVEDLGRRPGRFATLVAGLDPTSFVDSGGGASLPSPPQPAEGAQVVRPLGADVDAVADRVTVGQARVDPYDRP